MTSIGLRVAQAMARRGLHLELRDQQMWEAVFHRHPPTGEPPRVGKAMDPDTAILLGALAALGLEVDF